MSCAKMNSEIKIIQFCMSRSCKHYTLSYKNAHQDWILSFSAEIFVKTKNKEYVPHQSLYLEVYINFCHIMGNTIINHSMYALIILIKNDRTLVELFYPYPENMSLLGIHFVKQCGLKWRIRWSGVNVPTLQLSTLHTILHKYFFQRFHNLI